MPDGPERIDLALVDDLPTVLDVLRVVIPEYGIDRVVVTDEMAVVSPQRVADLRELLGDVPLHFVSHVELKRLAQTGKATIRTGDTCPYANLIVVSG